MQNNIKENQVVNFLTDYLLSNKYQVKNEVPNMGQSVDIVAKKGKYLTLIEVKISNWKRAIQQCSAHELIADFIYIAIATKNVSEDLIMEANRRGYGIYHCDIYSNQIKLVLKAKVNNHYWEPQRNIFLNHYKDIENVN